MENPRNAAVSGDGELTDAELAAFAADVESTLEEGEASVGPFAADGSEKPKVKLIDDAALERFRHRLQEEVSRMREADPMAMALAMKPGSHVVNGGRKRREAASQRHFVQQVKRHGLKPGRFTPPKPKGEQS